MTEPDSSKVATVEYHGSHGTSRTRRESIRKNQFPVSNGMRGSGFYLWRKSALWKELAQGWYRFRRARGDYDEDRNPAGVVLFLVAKTTEDSYLDLTDQDIIDNVANLAKRAKMPTDTHRAIGAAYEYYIAEMERELGTEFVIIETTVAAPGPQYCPEYDVRLRASPRCYVIRKTGSLTIISEEEFN